jgi:hypothetical protein
MRGGETLWLRKNTAWQPTAGKGITAEYAEYAETEGGGYRPRITLATKLPRRDSIRLVTKPTVRFPGGASCMNRL